MGVLRRLFRDEGGQAVVEFALSVIVLLIIVLGIFDLGRAVWYSNTLSLATREAVRCAIVGSPACTGTKSPADVVQAFSIGVNPAPEVTTVYCPNLVEPCAAPESAPTVGSYATVSANSVFVPIASRFFLGGGLNVTLTGSSTLLIRNDSAPATTPPTATPPMCTVPNFTGVQSRDARDIWTGAGFAAANFSRAPGNYTIATQTTLPGPRECATTTIWVGP